MQCFVYNGTTQYGGNIGKTITTGAFHHLAMTYDGSTLTGYLDGSAGGTTYSPTGNIATDTNNLALGRHGNLYNEGNAEDRGIWNRALTASEISNMYTYRLRCDAYPQGLIHYWRLDEQGRTGTALAVANDRGFHDETGGGLTAEIGNSAGWDVGRVGPILEKGALL